MSQEIVKKGRVSPAGVTSTHLPFGLDPRIWEEVKK